MPAMNKPLQTISELLTWAVHEFEKADLYFGHGTDNAWDEAVLLLTHALGLPPDVDESVLDMPLSQQQIDRILSLFNERIAKRIPAAYLIGEAWFAGLPFYVNPSVMIPRSPIAEFLVEGTTPWLLNDRVRRVLDLCTGSGSMAIVAAKIFPNATVDAVDISEAALAVATKNIARHHLQDRVKAIQSDLFTNLPLQSYDLILSNPPYVSLAEYEQLPKEYSYEPELAFKADDNGLSIVTTILKQAADYLSPNGVLVVEVGNSDEALAEAFPWIPFLWLEFEYGGHGVFLLTREQLQHSVLRR